MRFKSFFCKERIDKIGFSSSFVPFLIILFSAGSIMVSSTLGASEVFSPLTVLNVFVIFLRPSLPFFEMVIVPFGKVASSSTISLKGIISKVSSEIVPLMAFVP